MKGRLTTCIAFEQEHLGLIPDLDFAYCVVRRRAVELCIHKVARINASFSGD